MFEKVEAKYDENGKRSLVPTGEPEVFFPADDVLVAIGQENAFPWIERNIGVDFDKWEMPIVDKTTFQSTHPKVFFGGDAAFGPENVITAVAHGHQAAVSIDLLCNGKNLLTNRLNPMVNLVSQKMGIHEWAYDSEIDEYDRLVVPQAPKTKTLVNRKAGSRDGLRSARRLQGGRAMSQLRCADRLRHSEVHRVRRMRRHLPDELHHFHRKRRGRTISAHVRKFPPSISRRTSTSPTACRKPAHHGKG